MYLPIEPMQSCAKAWVMAASAVSQAAEGYNVVIDIADPVTHDAVDHTIISLVDKFLSVHEQNPIVSVANTIFPQALYRQHGAPKFYEVYDEVFKRFGTMKGWGRYFERLSRKRTVGDEQYRPIERLIEKLRKQNSRRTPFKAAYELSIYDADTDRNRTRPAPCLSFLSFKRHPDRTLHLTAIYRNQTYISRCLGNLIGLGRLQAFVAKESELGVGSLTCISTHAELDVGDGEWKLSDARALVRQAKSILDASADVPYLVGVDAVGN